MKCPNCAAEVTDGLTECPSCNVIFLKWYQVHRRLQRAIVSTVTRVRQIKVTAQVDELKALRIPAIAAAVAALGFAMHFRGYLPMPEGWGKVESVLFILSSLNLVFHEAGHLILGLSGIQFIAVAGGTVMQLAMPSAVFGHFWRRNDHAGMLAALFWIGENLVEVSYYMADAKMRALILIDGAPGTESDLIHDWWYMLGASGLREHCVGLAQLVFFTGCWCLLFCPAMAAALILARLNVSGAPSRS